MTERHFDVIVAGVGAMGSATCLQLARRGKRVLGLERFGIPNTMGSSHGATRIIRLAYAEGSAYVPLLRRAYELWRELETAAGEQLLWTTGYVDVGAELVEPSLASCREHGLEHELVDGRELGRRHPGFQVEADAPALLQPDGGFVLSERCVAAQAEQASALGAELHEHERVVGWEDTGRGVRVETEHAAYAAERLVVAAGAWAPEVARIPPRLVVAERQALAWFEPLEPGLFAPERFPCFGLVDEEGLFYGFPDFDGAGVKVGRFHHRHEQVDPDAFRREPEPADEAVLRRFVERRLPRAAGRSNALVTCLFELSPDEHFLIDLHHDSEAVVVAAGFSGHGFKFASVVGEILADLALDGATRHEIGFLGLARFDG
ncbi:MAG TPA: N-methyl-L-tryptophan oxidase [Gaiellaceae bacterium]|jgi:sarcosine oxidase